MIVTSILVPALLVAMLTGGGQSVLKADGVRYNDPSKRNLAHSNADVPKHGKLRDSSDSLQPTAPTITKTGEDGNGGTDKAIAECKVGNEKPDCNKASQCGNIRSPRHGGIRHIRNGSSIRYYCRDGYALFGQRSNKCVKHNGKYQWQNRTPQCRRSSRR